MTLADCGPTFILKIIYFIAQITKIAFIIIPIGLIVMVTYDLITSMTYNAGSKFSKYKLSDINYEMGSGVRMAIKRIAYAIVLFLVPSIVNISMDLLGNAGVDYAYCINNINVSEIETIEASEKELEELAKAANELAMQLKVNQAIENAEKFEEQYENIYLARQSANLDNVEDFEPILEIDESKKNVLLVTGHTRGYNAHTCNGIKHDEGNLVRDFARYLQVALYIQDINAIIANEVVDPIDMNAEIINSSARKILESKIDLTKIDYVIELHFNAFGYGATGTEIVVSQAFENNSRLDPLETAIAKATANYIGTLRHANHNGKNVWGKGTLGDEMYFRGKKGLNYTLIEIAFYDNCEIDMPNYYAHKVEIAEDMAIAIKENL